MPTIAHRTLLDFAHRLLAAGGAGDRQAEIVADSLVQANLRGHDSHGVMRIPFYLEKVRDGSIRPGASLVVEREAPASLACDGGWGFGQVLARDLMARLMKKAAATAVACGTLRRAAHIGRLGEYAEIAAAGNMAAIVCANTHGAGKRVAPIGGKEPRLGTNPICMGVSGGKDGPFIMDFSTSATAEGKVRVKRIAGQPVPAGWILDSEGRPSTDPNVLYANPPGTILPMGGDQAYKGFGLAFMIELLCGCLSGGQCSYPDSPPPLGNCALFFVIDPKQLGGRDHLLCQAGMLEEYVRTVPRVEGVARITLPGDPERDTAEIRSTNGIPLDEGNWQALVKLAEQLEVQAPAG